MSELSQQLLPQVEIGDLTFTTEFQSLTTDCKWPRDLYDELSRLSWRASQIASKPLKGCIYENTLCIIGDLAFHDNTWFAWVITLGGNGWLLAEKLRR
jgi:hypothetical protein